MRGLPRYDTARAADPLGWFLALLGDMRFARSFRVASPLCVLHQGRALERPAAAADLLAAIERSKLDRLATHLVQHRYRGDGPEVVTALRAYLVPTEAAPPRELPAADEGPGDRGVLRACGRYRAARASRRGGGPHTAARRSRIARCGTTDGSSRRRDIRRSQRARLATRLADSQTRRDRTPRDLGQPAVRNRQEIWRCPIRLGARPD